MEGVGVADFVMALQTGMSLAEVRSMRNVDYEGWQDFFACRRVWRELGKDYG